MDIFSGLLQGLAMCLTPAKLLYCLIGVTLGTLIGVLPGIGPISTISLLLPITFQLDAGSAIIMLAGIYYGAQYGGSTTSILVNIPGEASSVMTCLDGYQMARKGRAGAALGISAIGSFIAGTLSTIGLMLAAYPMAKIALRFGPPEFFSMMVLSLTLLAYLARGSLLRALSMAVAGILLSFIGIDPMAGFPRFTMGRITLMDGVGLVPMAMGLFGISEILINLETEVRQEVFDTKIRGFLPNRQELKRSRGPVLRGTLIGFLLGVIPGSGTVASTIISYGIEKRFSRYPEKFGTGMIEGVAGPESANNAAVGGSFVPLFALGIPGHATAALLLGAMMIHGIIPGPLLMKEHPDLWWLVVASMYIGNVILLFLNLPLIGLWVKLLRIPYKYLSPVILLLCVIGAYSLNNNVFDIAIMAFFGLAGYMMKKFNYEVPPLLMAFVLGPLMEEALRQSLLLSYGSFSIFFVRPISAVSLGLALVLLASYFLPFIKKRRQGLKEMDV
jgi:putative tricarboxylic transport membrane protein